MKKSWIRITASVCSIVILFLLIFSGTYIGRVYYNAEIMSCELYKDDNWARPFYSFKLYGNGKMTVCQYDHIGNLSWDIDYTPKFDDVSSLVIQDQGECQLSFWEQIEMIKILNQLNEADFQDNQASGFLTLARLKFCGNSYIQNYGRPKHHRTQADEIAIELIDKLIQKSPIQIALSQ